MVKSAREWWCVDLLNAETGDSKPKAVLQVKCPKRSWQAKGEPYEARHQFKQQAIKCLQFAPLRKQVSYLRDQLTFAAAKALQS